jgi:hypothetical protein
MFFSRSFSLFLFLFYFFIEGSFVIGENIVTIESFGGTLSIWWWFEGSSFCHLLNFFPNFLSIILAHFF